MTLKTATSCRFLNQNILNPIIYNFNSIRIFIHDNSNICHIFGIINITYTNILVKHTHFVFFILYNTLVNL